ncbi:hypothetical protein PR202_ga25490 [Eleusine coracana subsp. coracana]|uniref:Uncharacterized protein n=1 Tax=Eleusine coracana subsp. coracana TaxID=191504 RepID=A0AAV5DCE2_ELECO|nr:hypothetical protein PR202_ga25429 [Eleusine coracana subsp. coracana]GJN07645.1 hypothetical protein PR202_ga25490 [Eleusine coracana subsp. coracana]
MAYAHSPAHHAVATRARPRRPAPRAGRAPPRSRRPEEIRTEADSIAEEAHAEAVSAVIDRRDVPAPGGRHRSTSPSASATPPRHGDAHAAGADWSLQTGRQD